MTASLQLFLLGYFVLLVSAERNIFQTGKEYHYEYISQVSSDIEGVGSQVSVAGVKSTIIIQGYDDGVIFQLKDVKYGHVGDLKYTRSDLKSEIPLEYYSNPSAAPQIEKPVKLSYYRGNQIIGLYFDGKEPDFEFNFKLGVASFVNVNLDKDIIRNQKHGLNIRTEFNEETLYGRCNTDYTYQSTPLGANQQTKTFTVTKSTNYGACEGTSFQKWTTFNEFGCSSCEADNFNMLIGDGSVDYTIEDNRGYFAIKDAIGFSQLIFQPFSTTGDKLRAHTFQKLSLLWSGPIGRRITLPTAQLQYIEGFPFRLEQEFVANVVDPTKPPSAPYTKTSSGIKQRPEPQKVIQSSESEQKVDLIIRIIEEISLGLHDVQSIPEKDIVNKAVFGASVLFESQEAVIESVFRRVKAQETQKRLFIDLLTYYGNERSIKFLVKLISQGILVGEDAVRALPSYAIQGAESVINVLWELWKSPTSSQSRELYAQSLISFAVVLRQACAHRPVSFSSGFANCSDLHPKKYMQEIFRQFEASKTTAEQITLLVGLHYIAVPETFEVLKPYLTHKYETLKPAVRSELLKSLWPIAALHTKEIVELVLPIYFNTELTPVERIGAFYLILNSDPPPWVYLRIAISTWDEPSDNVVAIVYQTISHFANITNICGRKEATKARNALPFAKHLHENAAKSLVWFNYGFDDKTNVGVFQWLNVISNPASVVPHRFDLIYINELSGYYYPTFQFSLFLSGWQESLKRTFGEIFPEDSERKYNILNITHTKPRTPDEDFFNYYHLELFGNRVHLGFIDKTIPGGFLQFVDYQSLSAQLSKGVPINYHRFVSAGEYSLHLPSVAGVSIILNVFNPIFVDIKGKVSVSKVSPGVNEAKVDIVPTFAMNTMSTTGFIIPYLNSYSASGVQESIFLSLPISFKTEFPLEVGGNRWKTSIYRPKSVKQHYYIFKADIIPFTGFWNMTSTESFLKGMTFIETMKKPHKFEVTVGRQHLGIPVIIRGGSEILWQKHDTIWNSISEQGLLKVLGQFWVNPRFKRQQYEVLLDVLNADTDQLQLDYTVEYTQRPASDSYSSPGILSSITDLLLGWNPTAKDCKHSSKVSPTTYEKPVITSTATPYEETATTKKPGWFSSLTRPFVSGYKKVVSKIRGDSETTTTAPTTTRPTATPVTTRFPPYPEDKDYIYPAPRPDPDYRPGAYGHPLRPYYTDQPEQRSGQNYDPDLFKQDKKQIDKDLFKQDKQETDDIFQTQHDAGNPFGQDKDNFDFDDSEQTQQSHKPFDITSGSDYFDGLGKPVSADRYDPLNTDRYKSDPGRIRTTTSKSSDVITKYNVQITTVGRSEKKITIYSVLNERFNPPSRHISTTVDLQNLPEFKGDKRKICITGDVRPSQVTCGKEYQPTTVGNDETASWNLDVTWGKTCEKTNFFKLKGLYEKSEEQLKLLQAKEFDAITNPECEEQFWLGVIKTPICQRIYDERYALRKGTFTVEYQNIPPFIINATHKIDHYLKCLFHQQLSNNAIGVKNQDGRTTAIVRFHAEETAVDIQIFKPYENTFYTDIHYPKYIPGYRVPVVGEHLRRSLLGGSDIEHDAGKCSATIVGDVQTFNHLVYNYEFDGCSYVIAQDCINGYFQVALTSNHIDRRLPRREIAVSIFNEIIFILPPALGHQGRITIDKEYPLLEGELLVVSNREGKAIAVIVQYGSDVILQATELKFEVTFNENSVSVQASPIWTGQLCGLCGEYTYEKQKTFYSANHCLQTNTTQFAQSYAFKIKGDDCIPKPVQSCIPGDDTSDLFVTTPRSYVTARYGTTPRSYVTARYGTTPRYATPRYAYATTPRYEDFIQYRNTHL